MPHGYWDYGVDREVATVHASPDMAEGAVRLGAVSSIDRSGNVIEYDDFESSTLKWRATSVPAGYEPSRSTDFANSGSFSVKMPVPPGVGNRTRIYRIFGAQVTGRVGGEFKFTWPDRLAYLDFYCEVATGVEWWTMRVRYNSTAFELEYWDNLGAWQNLATGVDIENADFFFHTIKLVVDSVTGYYVRLIFDGVTYDMTQYPMERFAGATTRYIDPEITFYALGDVAETRYVDDVIFTQNEP